MTDPAEISSGDLGRLIDMNRSTLRGLAKRGIVEPGARKGTYALEASVSGYCDHLRRLAQGRHGS
jgi:hypothetical protein